MHYTPLTILDFAISFGETLRQDPKIEQDLKSRSYTQQIDYIAKFWSELFTLKISDAVDVHAFLKTGDDTPRLHKLVGYAKTFTMQDLYTVYADKKTQGYALDDYASVFNFVMNLVAAKELPDKLYSVEIDFLIYAHKTLTDPNVSVFSKIELRAAMADDVLGAVFTKEIDCNSL